MGSGSDAEGDSAALRGVTGTILLVGAGKMGSALLEGWLALGIPPGRLAVLEPQPSSDIRARTGRGLNLNPPPHSVEEIAAIVLAVKPQVAPEVMATLAPYVGTATVVVSIMAGRTLLLSPSGAGHSSLERRSTCSIPGTVTPGHRCTARSA